MNRIAFVVVTLLCLALPSSAAEPAAAAANIRACFVDLQEVLQSFAEYGKAKESLKTWAEPRQKIITEKEQELQKLDNELKKSMLISKDAREEKEKEFKKELEGYQTLVKQLQSDLSDKEEELLAPVKDSLSKTIEAVARDKGYNVVFDAAAQGGRPILYVDDGLDITKAVVAKLKAEEKDGKSPAKEKK